MATRSMVRGVMDKKSVTVEWNRAIAAIIDGLDSERFPERLID